MKALFLAVFLFSSASIACPELDGIDLGNDDGDIVEISKQPIRISRYKFKKIDGFKYMSYTACRNSLNVITLKSQQTGREFKAIVSNDDNCDGGNTYGGILDVNLKKVLGQIGDGQISCK